MPSLTSHPKLSVIPSTQNVLQKGLNAETFKSQYTEVFINSKGYYLGTSPGGMDTNIPSQVHLGVRPWRPKDSRPPQATN